MTLVAETGSVTDEELKSLVSNSRRVKNKISVPWAVQQRICRAIVLIHHSARYFEGMSILCALAGWKPRCLENEFDTVNEQIKTREQFNRWVRELAGGR